MKKALLPLLLAATLAAPVAQAMSTPTMVTLVPDMTFPTDTAPTVSTQGNSTR